jgi:hypothetical protein
MRHLCLLAALSLTLSAQVATELIPVEKFTQDMQLSRASLSPDGRYIASLQEVDNAQWLILTDLETKKSARVNPGAAINGLRKKVSAFRWVSNHRISFLTTVWDGYFFTGMSAVDADGKNWAAFTGPDVNPNDRHPLIATQILYSFGDKAQSVLMIDRGANEGKTLVYPDVIRVSTLTASVDVVVKEPRQRGELGAGSGRSGPAGRHPREHALRGDLPRNRKIPLADLAADRSRAGPHRTAGF